MSARAESVALAEFLLMIMVQYASEILDWYFSFASLVNLSCVCECHTDYVCAWTSSRLITSKLVLQMFAVLHAQWALQARVYMLRTLGVPVGKMPLCQVVRLQSLVE